MPEPYLVRLQVRDASTRTWHDVDLSEYPTGLFLTSEGPVAAPDTPEVRLSMQRVSEAAGRIFDAIRASVSYDSDDGIVWAPV